MSYPTILEYLSERGIQVTINDTDMNTHDLSGISLDSAFIPSDGITDYSCLAEHFDQEFYDKEELDDHLKLSRGYLAQPFSAAPADIYWGGVYMTELSHWVNPNPNGSGYDFVRAIPLGDQFYHNIAMLQEDMLDFKEYNPSLIWRYRECKRTCYGYGHHIHAIASRYCGTIDFGSEYFTKPPLRLADGINRLPSPILDQPYKIQDAKAGRTSQKEYVEACMEKGRRATFGADHPFALPHGKTHTVARALELRAVDVPGSFADLWALLCLSKSIALAICAFYKNTEGYCKEGYNPFSGQLADADEKAATLCIIGRITTAFSRLPNAPSIHRFLRIVASVVNTANLPESQKDNKSKFACLAIIHGGFRIDLRGRVYPFVPIDTEMSEYHIQSVAYQHERGWDQHRNEPEFVHVPFWEVDDGIISDEASDDEDAPFAPFVPEAAMVPLGGALVGKAPGQPLKVLES